jgi:hypothetical protein
MKIALVNLTLGLSLTAITSLTAQNRNDIPHIWKETIQIDGINQGYHKSISVQSISSRDDADFTIYYSSFERINKIDVNYYDKKKEKFRKYRKVDIGDFQASTNAFFSSNRQRKIGIPKDLPFEVIYETDVNDLMDLSQLYFSSPNKIDTFYYKLIVPDHLNLRYNVENASTLSFFKIDSVHEKGTIIYSFTGATDKHSDYLRKHAIGETSITLRECIVKLIITPKEYKNRESAYFNDWILEKIKSVSILNQRTKCFIDSLTQGITGTDSIGITLFDFVRSKIKYINIEIGYGAFIPNDVNKIFLLKQGDCKDKANLLCQALIYKGIDARLVCTSSSGYQTQMDFPCLGSANHMICAVKRSSSWIFLDPTEENGVYQETGLMTQGQMAFLLGNDGGQFFRIPPLKAEQNTERHVFLLGCHHDSISGTFMISFKGKRMQQELDFLMNIPSEEEPNWIKSLLHLSSRNLNYSSIRVTKSKDSLSFIGNVVMANHMFMRSDSASYLYLDFIPRPMEFTNEDPLSGDIKLSHTLSKQVEIHITMDKPFHDVNIKSSEYNKNGYQFLFSSSFDKNQLNVNYSFAYDDVIIPMERNDGYKQFKSVISNTFNNAIKFW